MDFIKYIYNLLLYWQEDSSWKNKNLAIKTQQLIFPFSFFCNSSSMHSKASLNPKTDSTVNSQLCEVKVLG